MTLWTGSVGTIAAGETTTYPAKVNTYRDILKATTEAWTAYTPALTATANPTLGTGGTIVGAWAQIGKLVHFRITVTFGASMTGGTGGWNLSLPIAAINVGRWSFVADLLDTATANYSGRLVAGAGSATAQLLCPGTSAGGAERAVSGTVPFTWGSGDQLSVTGTYESA